MRAIVDDPFTGFGHRYRRDFFYFGCRRYWRIELHHLSCAAGITDTATGFAHIAGQQRQIELAGGHIGAKLGALSAGHILYDH
ncbi:hypothetical protein D3C81_960530 [compost metagenome]